MSDSDYTIPKGYKRCSKVADCAHPFGPVLPATNEYFGNLSKSPDGLTYCCKICHRRHYLNRQDHYKAATKKRYWDNPEAAREYFAQHYQKNADRIKARVRDYAHQNIEKIRANKQRYRQTDACKQSRQRSYIRHRDTILAKQRVYAATRKEQKREYGKRYRAKNREQIAQSKRDWRINNPKKIKAIYHRYRVNKLNADGYWTDNDIAELYELQDGRCGYCGIPISFDILGDVHIDHMQPLSRGGSNWPDNLCLSCRTCNITKGNRTPDEWLG